MTGLRLAPDLEMPLDAVTQKFAILAQSGAGKSYTAMKLAEQMLINGLQVVVLDPVSIWWGLRSSADGKKAGLHIVVFGGEHGDLPLLPDAGVLVADILVDEGISAVVDLSDFELPEMKRFVTAFAQRFFHRKTRSRGPVHVFLEEAQTFAPQSPERDETTMLNRVERMARIGRNYGIGWSAISQRPQEVHKKVLNQAGTLIALRTIGTHERKALVDWVSDKAQSEAEVKLLDGLPSLETGVARIWSPAFLKIAREVRIGRRQTFDSSATPEIGSALVAPRTIAKVDVERLRQAMAATLEKARADDPRELRRRIAELERQVASKPAAAAVETKVVEVPVLTADQVSALAQVGGDAQVTATHLRDAADKLVEAAGQILGALVNARPGEVLRHRPAQPPIVREPVPRIDPVPTAHKRPATANAPAPRPEHAARQAAVTAPQQRILDALAAFEATGLADVAKSNVAVFAGQSSTSSGFANNLGALRSAGLIAYPSGGRVALTDAGRAAAAPTEPIRSVEQLHEAWRAKLSAPQWRILAALIPVYPDVVSRGWLADESRQSATSSGFANNLGALRSLGLIDYPANGMVAATDLLFPALPHRKEA